ncbi:MAG: amino acid adenylation domain-containing protein [Acidobacteriota bacterium]|nr:amino acid adenylation domain-containing protein [Acidobacteriota bacterium]
MFSESPETTSRVSADEVISWLRTYAETHIDSAAIDERRAIPPHILLDFGRRGLFGLRIPRRHGGLELAQSDVVRVLQQLAAIDLTLATMVSSHAIGLHTIHRFGRTSLKEELLPDLASGRAICAFALTERVAGSNPRAIQTRADPDGQGGWILNGDKYFVDSASWASVTTVFARTPEEGRASGISAFAVRRGTPGLTIGRETLTMGMRGMAQHDVHLRDVRVGPDGLLGDPGAGLAISQDTLSLARLNLAAKTVGGMKRCLQLLHRFATRRRVATGILWNNPVTSSRVGQLVSAVGAVEALVNRIAAEIDAGTQVPTEAFLACKVAGSEYLWKSAETLVQSLGARGYDEANHAPRILRDARSFLVSEGPTETLVMYLGSRVLNAGSEVERYLASELSAPRLARRLREATEEIRKRVSSGHLRGRMEQSNEAYWASWRAGEVAIWAILAAAAESTPHQDGSSAASWALLKFEERTKAILEGGSAEMGLGRGNEDGARILRFSESIGDVEQSAAGVAFEPDPLLRRESADTRSEEISVFESAWEEGVSLGGENAQARLLAALGALAARHTLDETVGVRVDDGARGTFDAELDFSSGTSLEDGAAQAAIALGPPSGRPPEHRPGAVRSPLVVLRTPRAAEAAAERSRPEFASGWAPVLAVTMGAEDGSRTSWRYEGRALGRVSAADLAGRLQELVRSWSEQPGAPFDRLPLLRRDEGKALVERWNQTPAAYPRDVSIHALIERQAALEPSRTAVASGAGRLTLTYGELDARAARLARRLRLAGALRETRVGLCVGRSLDLPVAMLAILKAGAAYVPLDTAQPRRRLAAMLDEMRFPVIVADESSAALLPPHHALILSPAVPAEPEPAGEKGVALEAVGAEDPAYVLYTSGSTGTPKAVEVSHRSVVNLLEAMRSRPGFSESDVLVAVTNVAFDIAGLELLLPLVSGGRLVIANARESLDGVALSRLLEESGATVLQGTPATWQMLLASGWRGERTIKALCGGETLPRELAARIRARTGSLWNMYGPTETTIWSCVEEVTEDGPVSIGRPIANTRVYILDDEFRPVPEGVPAEIFIAGDGVARGYWKRDDLTAEMFLPDPFRSGERMYRTGDVGRFLPDGKIEHLGRRDRQVKIRGFRVELGEVEAAIESHPAVREALVEPQSYALGDTRLVAWVILEREVVTDGVAAVLRGHVTDRVPSYMVPASFVVLEKFPLTRHGKLDRGALREAADERLADAAEPAESAEAPRESPAPGRNVEREIARIWSALLLVPDVSPDDDFFALGGHSLLATQVISRVRAAFRVEIPVETMFEQPTLAALVTAVERALSEGSHDEEEPAAEPASSGPEVELSSTQQRFWFLDWYQPGSSRYNVPVALHLRGDLDPEALRLAIEDLTARHEALRTRFQTRNGRPVQVIEPAGSWILRVVDLEELAEDERATRLQQLTEEEAERPFDLSGRSLLRTSLLRRSRLEHTLLLTMHHIITDGWSVEVMLRDLGMFYRARRDGAPAALPPLRMQYADFAAWEKKWLQGAAYQEHLAYWREDLAELPPLNLPTDRPRTTKPSQRGGHLPFTFTSELTASLRRLGKQQGATLFMVLMAAWQALLSRYCDQEDFGIGFPIANRTQEEFERVAGCFLNTLVLRADLSGDPTFAELLARVRRRALKAYAHQAVPFERLVQELAVRRDPARNPLFQAMFNLQNAPTSGAVFPGLESESLPVKTPTSKVDLTLMAREREGRLHGEWEYSTELFDATTIQHMAAHFETLLEAAASDPDQAVADLPLLATDSWNEVLAMQQGDAREP